jgi:hypothetical protein
VIARLRDHEIATLWEPAATGWVTTRHDASGASAAFLTFRDGACVFLRPDNLCAIHALLGEAFKPSFCREFPLRTIRDPRGEAVVVRAACTGAHDAFEGGTLVGEHAAGTTQLPADRPILTFQPRSVTVLPGLDVATDVWMEWEEHLLAELASAGPPEAVVARARQRVVAWSDSALPEPNPQRYQLALLAVLEALRMVTQQALQHEPDTPIGVHRARVLADMAAHIHTARVATEQPLPTLEPAAQRYFALLARSGLLGKSFVAHGSVAGGFGAILLDYRLAAAATGLDPVPLAPLGRVLAPWRRFAGHPAIAGALRLARPALVEMFIHAPEAS